MQVCNDMRCLYHINDCVSALRMEIIEIDVSSMFSCTFCMHVSAHKVLDAKTRGAKTKTTFFVVHRMYVNNAQCILYRRRLWLITLN